MVPAPLETFGGGRAREEPRDRVGDEHPFHRPSLCEAWDKATAQRTRLRTTAPTPAAKASEMAPARPHACGIQENLSLLRPIPRVIPSHSQAPGSASSRRTCLGAAENVTNRPPEVSLCPGARKGTAQSGPSGEAVWGGGGTRPTPSAEASSHMGEDLSAVRLQPWGRLFSVSPFDV